MQIISSNRSNNEPESRRDNNNTKKSLVNPNVTASSPDGARAKSALNDGSSLLWSKSNSKSSYRSKEDTIEYIDEDGDEDDDESNDEETTTTRKMATRNRWRPPDVWSDDVRMNALFAPFRSRELNPLHYDNKLKFWKELIVDYCRRNDVLEFDVRTAEHWFVRKQVKPRCLELAVAELARARCLLTRDEALRPAPAHGLIHAVFNRLVWTPLSWSASYLFRSSTTSTTTTSTESHSTGQIASSQQLSTSMSSPSRSGLDTSLAASPPSSPSPIAVNKYIFVELLESKSERLLSRLQERVVHTNVDTVIDYRQLVELFNDDENDNEIRTDQIDLIVRFLESQRKVFIDENSIPGRKLVKFTLTSSRQVSPATITEIEISFLKLKEEERKLESEIDRLGGEIENINTTIRVYLKQGNKTSALKLLKKRKLIEKTLESKDGILANVQSLIMSIEQADTNQMAYDVFSKGVSALKETHKGMSVDQIDETMYDLKEIIAANVEIEETLAKSPSGFTNNLLNIEESELNAELNELLAADESNDEVAAASGSETFNMEEILNNLPSIANSTIREEKPKTTTSKKPVQVVSVLNNSSSNNS